MCLHQVQSRTRYRVRMMRRAAAHIDDCGRQDCPDGAPPCARGCVAIFHPPYDGRRSGLPASELPSDSSRPYCSTTWLADRAYATTNKTSRAGEDQRRDDHDVLALASERRKRRGQRTRFGSACGTLQLRSRTSYRGPKTRNSKAGNSAVLKNSKRRSCLRWALTRANEFTFTNNKNCRIGLIRTAQFRTKRECNIRNGVNSGPKATPV